MKVTMTLLVAALVATGAMAVHSSLQAQESDALTASLVSYMNIQTEGDWTVEQCAHSLGSMRKDQKADQTANARQLEQTCEALHNWKTRTKSRNAIQD